MGCGKEVSECQALEAAPWDLGTLDSLAPGRWQGHNLECWGSGDILGSVQQDVMATQKGPHRNQKVPNFAFHCCDKTPRPKATWGENLSFSSASHSLREVVTGTELELETGGRVLPRVHGGVLLAELCSVACSSLFSYTLHDHVPRVDTTHHVLGLQYQSQRKSPTGLPTDQPGGTIFSKFSPWKMTWTHVTLTSNWLAQCPSVSNMEYQVVHSAHPVGNWAD